MPYVDPEKSKKNAKERYLKNLETRKAKMREDYQKKKEERIFKAREYALSNFEKTKEYQDSYRKEHKEELKEKKKKFYEANKERIVKEQVEYQRKNMKKLAERQKKYYATERGLLSKRTYRNNRRVREKNARLGNAFLKETLEIYRKAYKMRKEGFKVEVDHIVPISHPNVCGLHVPWNLQIIASKENRVKGNSFDLL